MEKQPYRWLATLSQIAWPPAPREAAPEGPLRLKDITAQAGTFANAQKKPPTT
jgi:hypothetical protein